MIVFTIYGIKKRTKVIYFKCFVMLLLYRKEFHKLTFYALVGASTHFSFRTQNLSYYSNGPANIVKLLLPLAASEDLGGQQRVSAG